MKLLSLSPLDLRALDEAFDGRLGDTLAAIVRAGHEPGLEGVRHRRDPNKPSTWTIAVTGGAIRAEFDANSSPITVAIASHLWLSAVVEELKSDVTAGIRQGSGDDAPQVQLSMWPGEVRRREPS